MKKCSKCKIEKPKSSFDKDKRVKSGLQSQCKDCRKSYGRYYTKEQSNEYNKKYRLDNLEKERERSRQHYHSNILRYKKYKEDNKEYYSEYNKIYKLENRDKINSHHQNRRARKKNAKGVLFEIDVQEMLDFQVYSCYYCNCDIKSKYHIEHKTPLSRGGSNLKENLCLSCPSCNFKKGSKTEVEFYNYLNSINYNFGQNLE